MNEEIEKLINSAFEKAKLFLEQKRYNEAESIYRQILKVDPFRINAKQYLGLILHKKGDFKSAINVYKEALEIDANSSDTHNNIAVCYGAAVDFDNAIKHANRAIELNPKKFTYYNNLALQYRNLGDPEKAVEVLKKATEVSPDEALSWLNLAGAYGQMQKLEDAENSLNVAINKATDEETLAKAKVDMAQVMALQAKINEEMWTLYQERDKCYEQFHILYNKYDVAKLWKDKTIDISGKKLVVYCEQGQGDFIQFSRLLSSLKCEVIIDVGESLEQLVIDNGWGKVDRNYTDYDYHCSVMSLPYLLNVDDWTGRPYVKSQTIDFSEYKHKFKIGICWGGNPQHPNDFYRSCFLKNFKAIGELPNVQLFSLQKDVRKRKYSNKESSVDLTLGCDGINIVDVREIMNDWSGTAKIIKSLDLVITIDTSVCHMAGAVGTPTWLLLSANPDWRWGIKGNTCIWYDSLVLFRQKHLLEWADVFDDVFSKLKLMLV